MRRFRQFMDERLDDLAAAGRDTARWNGRDVIAAAGLTDHFRLAGADPRVRQAGGSRRAPPVPASHRAPPPDEGTFGDETEEVLVEVFGGLGVALARSFRLLDEHVKNPRTEHRDRAFGLFRLLV